MSSLVREHVYLMIAPVAMHIFCLSDLFLLPSIFLAIVRSLEKVACRARANQYW